MRFSREWQEMVFTQTRQRYVPNDDRVSRRLHKTDLKVTGRVLPEARKEVSVGVGDAFRGSENAFAFRIFAYGDQDLAHRPPDARPVHLVLAGDYLGQPLAFRKIRQLAQAGTTNAASLATLCTFPVTRVVTTAPV